MNQKKKIGLCVGIPVGVIALALAAYFLFYPLIMIGQGNYAVYVNMYGVSEYEYEGDWFSPMESYAFSGCESLEHVTINGYVTDSNKTYRQFFCCSNLKTVTFGDGVWMQHVSNGMFTGCYNLESIVLPDMVSEIRWGAFDGCSKLTEMKLPEDLNRIEDYAFHNCIGIKEIDVPDKTVSIGSDAFSGCTSLEKVTIPKSVTLIDFNAFANCPNLETIRYEGTMAQWSMIGDNDLSGKRNLLGGELNGETSTTGAVLIVCTDGLLAIEPGMKRAVRIN